MAQSWKEAKSEAEKAQCKQVYHDFDRGSYGACRPEQRQGHFARGRFVEHRCICMPAHFSEEELIEKEKTFLEENPGWLEEE
ncbi:MAG TPA: hypothetical protein ENN85_06795 [Methanoculleus sp.]|nr:hypothetical protein [Methanoculleus sp.]